jgi:hypothetical protein
MLVHPQVATDLVGVALLAALLVFQRYKKRSGVVSTATTGDA